MHPPPSKRNFYIAISARCGGGVSQRAKSSACIGNVGVGVSSVNSRRRNKENFEKRLDLSAIFRLKPKRPHPSRADAAMSSRTRR